MEPAHLTRFAHTVAPQLFAAGGEASDQLSGQAAQAMSGPSRVWRHGTLAVAIGKGGPGQMPLYALLDDQADLETPEAQESWREWLHLANATIMLPAHQATFSAASTAAPRPDQAASVPIDLSPGWAVVADEFGGEEAAQVLIGQLSDAGVAAPDGEVGQELGDGIPFDLVWEQARIAVQLIPSPETVSLPGWRVVPPEADLIVAVWKEHQGG